jgi:hypothetical protein
MPADGRWHLIRRLKGYVRVKGDAVQERIYIFTYLCENVLNRRSQTPFTRGQMFGKASSLHCLFEYINLFNEVT